MTHSSPRPPPWPRISLCCRGLLATIKLRRCGRRLRSLRRPHGSLRLRRLLALLPGRSKRRCDSRQRSRLRRGRSRRRTSCTRTPRPGRSSTASSSISSLGASGPTRSSRTGRRRSGSCKPSRWTATRARCGVSAGSGTRARCARSRSAARTLVGRLSPGCGLMEITTTARCTSSRSSVAATPSSCARCRLPAAPPSQMRVRTQYYPQYRATDACRISVCGRRLLRPLRVRQLLRVLSPCCVLRSCCSCLASDIRMCSHMDV